MRVFKAAILLALLLPTFAPAQQEELPAAAAEIESIYQAQGLEAAIQRFHQIRTAEADAYSLTADSFLPFVRKLLASDQADAAIGILSEVNDNLPPSGMLQMTLASALRQVDRHLESYPIFNQALESMSKSRLQQLIDKGGLLTSADQVIARHIEAIGGAEALRRVDTMVVNLAVHDVNGINQVITRHYKRPDKFRESSEGSSSEMVVNGDHIWRVNADKWQEVTSRTYLRLSRIDDFLLDYQESEVSYTYKGLKTLGFSPVYHLTRTFADGYREELFFSYDFGYLTAKLTPYNSGPSYLSIWDYRQVGEIKIPQIQIREVAGSPAHGSVVAAVKLNVELADDLFEEPGK